ncbi:MAG: deoxyribodipyrimidine photolyase [Candidatus Marinimicrobia bacterium]|nr:deoxyribodipyrimidine photolyase [Candidatus Neomarinimicrobiota bacterium]
MNRNIILFKNNLRINDNPVLKEGSENSYILPIYIHDESYKNKKLGSASSYFLYHSLISLNKSLNNKLHFFKGNTLDILLKLIEAYDINQVYIEEFFHHEDIKFFNNLKRKMNEIGVNLKFINCQLLWRPYELLKEDNTPYKVFTPFFKKKCLQIIPKKPVGKIDQINFINTDLITNIEKLNLISKFAWYKKFDNLYKISEIEASNILENFIQNRIFNYKIGRDFPSQSFNSNLSPYIRFGLISINKIWFSIDYLPDSPNKYHFLSELGWREFSYYQLYHFPEMENGNLQTKFNDFQWSNNQNYLQAWKLGKTGFPFVDAGMRELWNTGFMHNRLRMIVVSFLVKNLQIDWRIGEKWFWDCLIDADYASNIAGWQWAAGTGVDAAPYFRIFNPIIQGEKFDSNGVYTKKYIPELSDVDKKYLFQPWLVNHDSNYPEPIIDFKESRIKALNNFKNIS